jgi:hypothetical protein
MIVLLFSPLLQLMSGIVHLNFHCPRLRAGAAANISLGPCDAFALVGRGRQIAEAYEKEAETMDRGSVTPRVRQRRRIVVSWSVWREVPTPYDRRSV